MGRGGQRRAARPDRVRILPGAGPAAAPHAPSSGSRRRARGPGECGLNVAPVGGNENGAPVKAPRRNVAVRMT